MAPGHGASEVGGEEAPLRSVGERGVAVGWWGAQGAQGGRGRNPFLWGWCGVNHGGAGVDGGLRTCRGEMGRTGAALRSVGAWVGERGVAVE